MKRLIGNVDGVWVWVIKDSEGEPQVVVENLSSLKIGDAFELADLLRSAAHKAYLIKEGIE